MRRRATRNPRPGHRFRPGVAALEDRRMLSADVLTYHNDNARSGVSPDEPALTPAAVNASTFGKVGFDAVDGKVDAQPLYAAGVAVPGRGTHNVLYVATENDSVYALDADTGATLWRASMLGPGEVPSDPVAGSQVTPEIGVTATPVIDPATGTMYVVAMSKRVSGGATTYIQRLHALNIATGADEVAPRSIDGTITYPGAGPGGNGTVVAFDPRQYEERDALLLSGGVVYTGWASHSDNPPYTGWLIGFRASDLSLASVLNIDPNGAPKSSFLDDGSGNSFWNSGGGPAADASGNLYNLSANGPFDPTLDAAGFPANGDYGDSMIKVTPAPSGLSVSDYFTPSDQQNLANGDEDLGSSGATLVKVTDASGATRQLLIGSGKDGNIYAADTANMGKFHPAGDQIDQELRGAVGGAEFGSPAAFNGQVYFGGVGATLRAFRFVNGTLQATPASQSSNTFAYPGATPSVSSDGNGGGIVWAIDNAGGTAVLDAYDASDLSRMLYNSAQAPGGRDTAGADNKFITPTIADGRVFVATTNGVAVYGLLHAGNPPAAVEVGLGDFDGDGKTDQVVFRPATDQWVIDFSAGGSTVVQFGDPAKHDVPAPGDYEGNGKTDLAVFRPGTDQWIIRYTDGSTHVFQFGDPSKGDLAVPGDYDGDGKTDLAVFRPGTDQWIVQNSSGTKTVTQFGDPSAGDVPVPGDYEGIGKTDLAVFRPLPALTGNPGDFWIVRLSGGGNRVVPFTGPRGAGVAMKGVPVPGDFDGDGQTDFALVDGDTDTWYIQDTGGATTVNPFGDPSHGDLPAWPTETTYSPVRPAASLSRRPPGA